jgi:hypothetical protein
VGRPLCQIWQEGIEVHCGTGIVESPAVVEPVPHLVGIGEGDLRVEDVLGGSSEGAVLVGVDGRQPHGVICLWNSRFHPLPAPHPQPFRLLLRNGRRASFTREEGEVARVGAAEGAFEFEDAVVEGAGVNVGAVGVGPNMLSGADFTSRYYS